MANMGIVVRQERRRAAYTPNKWRAASMGILEGCTVDVHVLGLFQVKDNDECDANFVIELQDGSCTYAGVGEIRFLEDTQ